ncbi:MAG: glucose-6-phosphate isomerase, partial [Verrucomicrobiaceae bacterium]
MSWQSYNQSIVRYPKLAFSLDLSLMDIPADHDDSLGGNIAKAFSDMQALESGAIANPDEQRMVGHYWLRTPGLAPTAELRGEITAPLAALKIFAENVHTGTVAPPSGGVFEQILLIGIGGSALGPQLVADALGQFSR